MTLAVVSEAYHVFRGWALHNAARGIVVRPVARAEVALPVACLSDRHTTKVRADSENDAPLWLLYTFGVRGWVAQFALVLVFNGSDLVASKVPNEDRLASPLDRGAVSRTQLLQVILGRRHGHHISRGGPRVEEL